MSPWNKVRLIQTYLPDVEILIWIDLDGLIQKADLTLDKILPEKWVIGGCNSLGAKFILGRSYNHTDSSHYPGLGEKPFFWVSHDVSPLYAVNVNTAVMAIRRSKIAFDFLDRVWEVGNIPNVQRYFDDWWKDKVECEGYWGWPWEQGGVWYVLGNPANPAFLMNTCVLPYAGEHALNSVSSGYEDGHVYKNSAFILHHSRTPYEYWLLQFLNQTLISPTVVKEVCHNSVSTWLEQNTYSMETFLLGV
jgi:hypothetical protein